jgi:hypothetical protein
MPSLLDHLRRHILSASAEAIGDLSAVQADFGETKVSNFDVAIVVNQQVLRLEVSVDDILLVEVHEAVENFDEVEFGVIF